MKNQPYLQIPRANYFSLIILIIVACSSENKLDIQGHRGCRGLMPENSLPAFQTAIDLGVTTIELDIAITKDNEVIVSHEPFMSRIICVDSTGDDIPEVLDKAYNLYKMSHNEIKTFDCGSKFHQIYTKQKKLNVYKPLLKEVFTLVRTNNSDVRFNIEIKSKPEYYGVYTPEPSAYVKLVLQEIGASGMVNRISLQSFDLNILEQVKKQAPDMPVALLVDEGEEIDKKMQELSFNPEIISPYYKLLSKKDVIRYQDKGHLVIPWTVNKVQDMKQLISWRVDGLITDYPDLLIKLDK